MVQGANIEDISNDLTASASPESERTERSMFNRNIQESLRRTEQLIGEIVLPGYVSFNLREGVFAQCLKDDVDPVSSGQFLDEPIDPRSRESVERYGDVIQPIFDDVYFGGARLEELNFIDENNDELTFSLQYKFPYNRYPHISVKELNNVRSYFDSEAGAVDIRGCTSGELIYLASKIMSWDRKKVRTLFTSKHKFFDEDWACLVGDKTVQMIKEKLVSGKDSRLPEKSVERIFTRIKNLGNAIRMFSDIEKKDLIPSK